MIGASLVGYFYRDEVAAYVTQYGDQRDRARSSIAVEQADGSAQLKRAAEAATVELQQSLKQERERAAALASELAQARREVETQVRLSSKTGEEAAQIKQSAETATVELQQSLKQERERAEVLAGELAKARREVQVAPPSKTADEVAPAKPVAESTASKSQPSAKQDRSRTDALASELAKARRDVETQREQTAQLKQAADTAAKGWQQSVQQERARAEALAGELAKAKREVETQAAVLGKKDDEAAQLKRTADAGAAELQQSVRQERERAEALSGELAKAKLQVETQVALLSKKDDESAQLKRTADTGTAELQQSVQQERARAETLMAELAKAKRVVETQVALLGKKDDGSAQLKQAAETATTELQQSVQQERARAETLMAELSKAKRVVETQVALLGKKDDEAAQLKLTADTATAELQSVQQERARAEALAAELATAKREVETQAGVLSKKEDEAAQLKRSADTTTAELRQSVQQERARAEALAGELAKREMAVSATVSHKQEDEAAQLKRAAESATSELQQSLQQQRDKIQAMESELAKARRDGEAQIASAKKIDEEAAQLKRTAETSTADMQKSLQQQRERAEALATELTKAKREVETQAAVLGKKDDEAAQLKRIADTATAELQSVRQDRSRAEALATELAKAKREVETQAAVVGKKDDEAAQLKRTADTTTAELRQSVQQERARAEALTGELAKAKREMAASATVSRKQDDEAAQPGQTTKNAQAERRGAIGANLPRAANNPIPQAKQTAVVAEPPLTAEAKASAEAGRLLERANALLSDGNIGAARALLERVAETGSAQATFRLAETYDPKVLATWRTYGTQGDATKARELYAKAYDGGIKAAKDRSDALQPAGAEAK